MTLGRLGSRGTWGLVFAAVALQGCRTGSAAAAAAAPCPAPSATGAPASTPGSLVATGAPTVLVVSGDDPFLVLEVAVRRATAEDAALSVAFMASADPREAEAKDAPRRVAGAAIALLHALGPTLPNYVRSAEVAAVFGLPGSRGAAVTARFARDEEGWSPTAAAVAHDMLVPPLPPVGPRPVDAEKAAVAAARRFLERLDAGDLDGAWKGASAAVKARMSRNAFERDLEAIRGAGARPPREERFHQYDARPDGLLLGDLLLVCFEGAGGVDRLQMRLDDDQEWRVVHVAHADAGGPRVSVRTP